VSIRGTATDGETPAADLDVSAFWRLGKAGGGEVGVDRNGVTFSGTFDIPPGSGRPGEQLTITVTAVDAAGNPGSQSVTIPCDEIID
jgi:hypothetical protein